MVARSLGVAGQGAASTWRGSAPTFAPSDRARRRAPEVCALTLAPLVARGGRYGVMSAGTEDETGAGASASSANASGQAVRVSRMRTLSFGSDDDE